VEDQLASSESNVTKNLIQLYRALGGGWEIVDFQEATDENGSASELEVPAVEQIVPMLNDVNNDVNNDVQNDGDD
jgi:hypothetical protein